MRYRQFDYKSGATSLLRLMGASPKNVVIYTICKSIAPSGMSAVIRAFVIKDNKPFWLGEGRVHGCGLDRGHEAAYNMFCIAYPKLRYQDFLDHQWV